MKLFRRNRKKGGQSSGSGLFQALGKQVAFGFKIAGLGVIFGGLVYIGYETYRKLEASDFFRVKRIVVQGVRHIQKEEVLRYSRIYPRMSIFDVKPGRIVDNLRQNPWIKKVVVTKNYPDALYINVEERIAKAIALIDDLYLVDEAGDLFKKIDARLKINFPIITGILKADYVKNKQMSIRYMKLCFKVIDLFQPLLQKNDDRVSEVHFDKILGVTLITQKTRLEVRLGWEDFQNKVAKLDAVNHIVKQRGIRPSIIFLDNVVKPERVTVRIRKA